MPALEARRQAAVADFVRRVRAALGQQAVDIRLFGSVARGDAQPDSDIDVLIVVQAEDDRPRNRKAAMARAAQDADRCTWMTGSGGGPRPGRLADDRVEYARDR